MTTCSTCENGCDCPIGTPGCGHYCCWGVGGDDSCPAVPTYRERTHAALDRVGTRGRAR